MATWLLTGGGIVAGVCSVASLALLGFTFLAQLPQIAQRGNWSAAAFRATSPVSRGIAFVALAALGVVMLAAVWVAVRRVWAVRYAHRACRRLASSGGSGPVVLVDDDHLQAYAVPGHPGRIVISRDLNNQLTPTERRVLLAHEHAHLDFRHHWYQFAAAIAAALNPLLASLPRAVQLALERWADETAAERVGSRARVAVALGRVALLRLHADPIDHPLALGATSQSRSECRLCSSRRREPAEPWSPRSSRPSLSRRWQQPAPANAWTTWSIPQDHPPRPTSTKPLARKAPR